MNHLFIFSVNRLKFVIHSENFLARILPWPAHDVGRHYYAIESPTSVLLQRSAMHFEKNS